MMYTFNDHVQQNVLSGIHRAKHFDMYHELNHYIHLNVLFHYFLSYSLIFLYSGGSGGGGGGGNG